ncbi:MAG: hypothetical protein U0169_22315 [Polyangiaceae bacterium]
MRVVVPTLALAVGALTVACSQTLCVDAYDDLDVVMTEDLGGHVTEVTISGQGCTEASTSCTFRKRSDSPCTRYSIGLRAAATCRIEVRFDDRPLYYRDVNFVNDRSGECTTTLVRPEYPAFRVPDNGPGEVVN